MLARVTLSHKTSLRGICKKCVSRSQYLTCTKGKKGIPKKTTTPALVGGAAPGGAVAIRPILGGAAPGGAVAIRPILGGVTSNALTPKSIDEAHKVLEDIKKSTGRTPLPLKDKNAKLEY